MMMFLSILCAGTFVLAVLVAMLGPGEYTDQSNEQMRLPAQPGRFFGADAVRRRAHDDLAVDLMLAQIERHVRQEQAAAEAFLAAPSSETLGREAASPPVN